MAKISLGYKDPYPSCCEPAKADKEKEEKEEKIVFPTFTINGDAAKAFMRKFAANDETTITMGVRVSMVKDRGEGSRNHWEPAGCTVEFECMELIGDFKTGGGDSDDGESASSAISKHFGKKTDDEE